MALYQNTNQKKQQEDQPKYQTSNALQQAANTLQQYENSAPKDYQSNYGKQIDKMLQDILNRKEFSYDVQTDPVYHQYKGQYLNAGNLAMRDTMANAAALSGGYGNSYASSAGNQAYQQYVSQIGNIIPELYQAAYNRYRDEGDRLYNQMEMLQDLEQEEYQRYRDSVDDFYGNRGYYYSKYEDIRKEDYDRYQQQLDLWMEQQELQYKQQQDALELWYKYGSSGSNASGSGSGNSTANGSAANTSNSGNSTGNVSTSKTENYLTDAQKGAAMLYIQNNRGVKNRVEVAKELQKKYGNLKGFDTFAKETMIEGQRLSDLLAQN